MKTKPKYSEPDNSRRVADLKKGKYADRHPLDEVKYLERKLILKGDRFTAESNFNDFGKVVKQAVATKNEIDLWNQQKVASGHSGFR